MRVLLLLLTFWAFAPAGFAAEIYDEAFENRVREISHKLRCPTCQAMSVKESEAGLSNNMKAMIRQQLKEGKSEEEILQYFVDRYGEWILRNPKKSGFNLLLWLTPGVILVLAGGWVIWRAKNKAVEPDLQARSLSGAEAAEIDKDLQRLKED